MFEKKQLIYSGTLGICQVDNIVNLSATKGIATTPYYVLKQVMGEKKTSYIPVEEHQVELREIFTKEEANELIKDENNKKNEVLYQALKYVLEQ